MVRSQGRGRRHGSRPGGNLAGGDGEILDAFVFGGWSLDNGMRLTGRLGQHAVQWGETLFFVAVGVLLFVAPSLVSVPPTDMVGYVLGILMLRGPVEGVINTFPTLSQAAVAAPQSRVMAASPTRRAIPGGRSTPGSTRRSRRRASTPVGPPARTCR